MPVEIKKSDQRCRTSKPSRDAISLANENRHNSTHEETRIMPQQASFRSLQRLLRVKFCQFSFMSGDILFWRPRVCSSHARRAIPQCTKTRVYSHGRIGSSKGYHIQNVMAVAKEDTMFFPFIFFLGLNCHCDVSQRVETMGSQLVITKTV